MKNVRVGVLLQRREADQVCLAFSDETIQLENDIKHLQWAIREARTLQEETVHQLKRQHEADLLDLHRNLQAQASLYRSQVSSKFQRGKQELLVRPYILPAAVTLSDYF